MTVPIVYGILGFTSDWDVLYNDAIRNKMFLASLGIMILSTLLSVLPFLFYDLTDVKHRKIIEDLKQRANDKDNTEVQELQPSSEQNWIDHLFVNQLCLDWV